MFFAAQHFRWTTQLAIVAILSAIGFGCGRSYPKCIEVSGRVTYQGQPVKNGWISFTPRDPAASNGQPIRAASGDLQEDGSYELKTFREGDGVFAGEYVVTIKAFDPSGAKALGSDPQHRRLQSTIPAKYSSTKTSGLTASIPPDASGGLQFDFDLKD